MIRAGLVCGLLLCLTFPAAAAAGGEEDALFQYSTIDALLFGVYDGELTVGELLERGDFGLGTFNGLDGEMVVYQGRAVRVGADGRAVEMPEASKTPLAMVAKFAPDFEVRGVNAKVIDELAAALAGALPTANAPYAVLVEGPFEYVKARSVPRQTPPYRELARVVAEQSVFEFAGAEGVMVGFYCPAYLGGGMNVPGFHLHFLSAEGTRGGHVLDVRVAQATARLDRLQGVVLRLPRTAAFAGADLARDRGSDLHRVER